MINNHSRHYLAKLALVTLIIMVVSACTAVAENAGSNSEGDFESALKSAESARKQAASAGGEWRDTKEIIKQAEESAKAGDTKTAIKLANKARVQSELGLQQTKDNKAYLKLVPEYNPDATPAEDLKNLQGYFRKKFPDLPDEEFANGNYALDEAMRENWEAIEEFPPYEPFIDEGETLWDTAFKNGKGYKDCFPEPGITNTYPRWDSEKSQVVTVPVAINACREKNGEKPLKYGKKEMLQLQAYMAFESRGKPTKVIVPEGTSPAKLEMIKFYGGDIEFFGTDCLDAEARAQELVNESGGVYVSPYNDEAVVCGQGTIGVEVSEQLEDIDAVIVSVGGGGMIGGIGTYLKSIKPNVKIVAASPKNSGNKGGI